MTECIRRIANCDNELIEIKSKDVKKFFDSFLYKDYNWWFFGALLYGHLAALYGLWLVPSAQWKTLLYGS